MDKPLPRILFVDDEQRMLDGIKRMLFGQRKSWTCDFVTNPTLAREAIAATSYDLVVLDVMMPGENGLSLLMDIKGDELEDSPEVLILTGMQEEALKRQALALGALDLLQKPIEQSDLVARIHSLLRVKQLRDTLRQQRDDLERQVIRGQQMELIGTMSSGAIHDLRNVLGTISGRSELFRAKLPADSHLQGDIATIITAVSRGTKLLEQILGFARSKPQANAHCKITDTINECLSMLKPMVPRGITVDWFPAKEDLDVYMDSIELFQVIMNLCINAVQAMKTSGHLLLECWATSGEFGEGYCELRVRDNGPGMDEETKARIFEPAFTTKSGQGGSGLGLSVVQRIIDNRGGKIMVDSKPDNGTSFRLVLPLHGNS